MSTTTPRGGGLFAAFKRGQILVADLLRAAHSLPDILRIVVSCSHPNLRTNTIPAAPEVIPPVRLPLQRWIAFEKFYRCFAFQYAHDFRYR